MAQNRAVKPVRAHLIALAVALVGAIPAAQSPAVDASAVFRVFLKDGQALPSYGESAQVGDRVVFMLIIGAANAAPSTQLISLPAASVDVDRTRRYSDAIRLKLYAATRGEVDYAAMTQEVQRALAELTAITDPKMRLATAVAARKRLLDWAASTYGYRAADIQELVRLFDEVILELRAAAGETQFALDLRAGTAPAPEPLLAPPTLRESIQLALAASVAADSEEDRLAILRAASALVSGTDADLRTEVTRAMDLEAKATSAYEALAADLRARAAEARKKADVNALSNAIETLRARDRDLGGRRPQVVTALTVELDAMMTAARNYHEALERYTAVRRSLLDYERAVRPTMSGFDGLMPVLLAVRDGRYTAYERLVKSGVRLKGFLEALEQVSPPSELADVQSTFISAIRMADHACTRRRLAVATMNKIVDQEASSAAAGAMLLAAQAREQLVARLYPPKIQ
jgi:hypothetical protein